MEIEEGHLSLSLEGQPHVRSVDEPMLLTVQQACRLLNCGRTLVFELLAQNLLQRRKLGRATRITRNSVEIVARSGAASLPRRARLAEMNLAQRRQKQLGR